MKLWSPLGIIAAMTGGRPREAAPIMLRWGKAFDQDARLAEDLIVLGRVLELMPADFDAGEELRTPIDPCRLAYEQGQRDLALRLLALGNVGPHQLYKLTETDE